MMMIDRGRPRATVSGNQNFSAPSRGRSRLGITFGLVFLFGLYTNIELIKNGSVLCAAVFCGVGGFPLLLLNARRVRMNHLTMLAGLNGVGALSIILSPRLSDFLVEELKAYLQFSYALLVSYGFYLEASRWPARFLRRLFGWAAVLILVGSALEVYTPFVAVSDAFRSVAYYRYIYEAAERDLSMVGHVRPKLFTQEPSYVAMSLVTALTVWYGLSSGKRETAYLGLAFASGMWLLRSPVLVALIPVLVLSNTIKRRTGQRDSQKLSRLKSLVKLVRLLLLPIAVPTVALIFFGDRFALFSPSGHDYDQSSQIRLTVPYRAAFDTLGDYPLFGVGLGAFEAIQDLLYNEVLGVIADTKRLNTLAVNGLICNSFCEMLIFYGLVGTALTVLLMKRGISVMGNGCYLYVFVNQWVIMNAQGAFVSTRVWSNFLILMLVCEANRRTSST